MPQIVLVTSATGRIGKEVVARLAKNGDFTVRAAAHNPEKAEYLKGLGAAEIVPFDLTDPATWGPALDGVSAVYSASLDPLLEHHLKFAAHLGTLGGQLLSSALGRCTKLRSLLLDDAARGYGRTFPVSTYLPITCVVRRSS